MSREPLLAEVPVGCKLWDPPGQPRAARVLRPGEYVTRSCATYGAALRHFGRYYPLLEDAAEIELEVRGEVARVTHRMHDPASPSPRHGVEMLIAGWAQRGRRAIGKEFFLREAFFRHEAPRNVLEHRRLFGPRLRFGASTSGIAFDRRWLEAPLPTADEGLRTILERQAEAQLARLPADQGWEARARRALVPLMDGQSVRLAPLARALGASRRTVQRGLAEEGTSFQAVTARVRRELATTYLAEGRRTLAEISFLLGFSEPSAFQRAFRRWMGTTPQAYRLGVIRGHS